MYPQIGGLLLLVGLYVVKIPFSKEPKAISEQILLLRSRGMLITDEAKAEHDLSHLNYCRLGAYWLPFEADHQTHRFHEGTTLERVVELYLFDRELRLHILDAIERVEVSVRSQWAYQMGMQHGPHAHLDPTLARVFVWWDRNREDLLKELERSHETFVHHFKVKYNDVTPPVWAVCEVMSLGLLSKWFGNLKPHRTRKLISNAYDVDHDVLASWMQHLTHVRNICAHHGRLWNREFTVTPKLPRSKPMHIVEKMNPTGRGLYNSLVILNHLLAVVAPGNTWSSRLVTMINRYNIDPKRMGFSSSFSRLFYQ